MVELCLAHSRPLAACDVSNDDYHVLRHVVDNAIPKTRRATDPDPPRSGRRNDGKNVFPLARNDGAKHNCPSSRDAVDAENEVEQFSSTSGIRRLTTHSRRMRTAASGHCNREPRTYSATLQYVLDTYMIRIWVRSSIPTRTRPTSSSMACP